MSDVSNLIPERDAAKILGVSIAFLQKARWQGTGPTYIKIGGKAGRAVRYRMSDLVAYIEANVVRTSDDC